MDQNPREVKKVRIKLGISEGNASRYYVQESARVREREESTEMRIGEGDQGKGIHVREVD
eukprot:2975976-Rhodomonas_salina.4